MTLGLKPGGYATVVGAETPKPVVILAEGKAAGDETLPSGETVAEYADVSPSTPTRVVAYCTDLDAHGITWMTVANKNPVALADWVRNRNARTYTYPISSLEPRSGRWGDGA